MDDTLLASRATSGDLNSFGELYDRYFHRVYDFTWRLLRDADEAAAATREVFERVLDDPAGVRRSPSFKAWLFSIAHAAAVGRAEREGREPPQVAHEEAFGAFDVPDASRLENPGVAGDDHELPALIWEAATALNPRDYAVLDLHVRQDLDSAELASVMNVSKGNAYTLIGRMKTAAGDVMGSYVIARRNGWDCEGLRATLSAFEFPPYSEEVRRAVDEHIRGCDRCRESREQLPPPLDVFGSLAPVAAPMALKGDLWRDLAGGWGARTFGPVAPESFGDRSSREAAPLAAGGGGSGGAWSGSGTGSAGWDRRNLFLFGGAVVGLLVFAFIGGAIIANALDGGGDAAGADETPTAEAGDTGTPGVSLTPGVAIETATPDLTPEATETAAGTDTPSADTPTPPPVPTDTPPPPPPTDTPAPVPPTAPPGGGGFPTSTPTPAP